MSNSKVEQQCATILFFVGVKGWIYIPVFSRDHNDMSEHYAGQKKAVWNFAYLFNSVDVACM